MRDLELRGLHGDPGRARGEVVHPPRRAGGRLERPHGRGPPRGGGAGPPRGCAPRAVRRRLRVLRAGHDRRGEGPPPGCARAVPGRHRPGPRGHPLPVHRPPAQGRCDRGRRPGAPRGRGVGVMDRGTAAALATGAARFLDDLPLPGALHVKVLRSIHAHARILSIDAGPALRSPGVAAVYTGADLRALCSPLPFPELGVEDIAGPARHALEPDEATYAGEPLAAVVAEGRREARDALDAIDVAFEPLPPVTDPEKAAEPGSARARQSLAGNVAFRCHIEAGDPGSAFRNADRVVRARMRLPRTIPAPIETRGVAAAYAPEEDTLTVWTTASAPHALREALSRILRRTEGSIRVIAPPARGGGPLGLSPSPEEALVAALALAHAPRPVRWMESRRENLLASGHARGQYGEGEAAFRNDGRLLAVRWRGVADLGAHLTLEGALTPFATAHLVAGAYNVPSVEVSI